MPRKVKAKTRIVNLQDERYDVPITRETMFGNPYIVGKDGTREEVLEFYTTYITNILKHNPSFLEPLRGKVLGCYCKPEACHGDIIIQKLGG